MSDSSEARRHLLARQARARRLFDAMVEAGVGVKHSEFHTMDSEDARPPSRMSRPLAGSGFGLSGIQTGPELGRRAFDIKWIRGGYSKDGDHVRRLARQGLLTVVCGAQSYHPIT